METQSKKRRVTPVEDECDNTKQADENTAQVTSVHLTYDVLRIIFQYLNYKDLVNASLTCRAWLEAANNEKESRISYINFIASFNYKKDRQPIKNFLSNIWIKPQLGLYFTGSKCYLEFLNWTSNLRSISVHNDFKGFILDCYGLIMDSVEIENEPKKIICTLIPKIPNVQIQTFKIREFSEASYCGKELYNILDQLPTIDQNTSTCVMLFCNLIQHHDDIETFVAKINSYSHKISSLWGGVIRIHKVHDRKRSLLLLPEPHSYGIVFSGAIKTWSIILNETCDTKKKIEARLKSWKDQITLKKYSIGFMFACFARGRRFHEEPNVESTIYKRLFPTVPLVGCFGQGEFGKDTIPVHTSHNEQDPTIKQKSDEFDGNIRFTQYSTVFMILTYG